MTARPSVTKCAWAVKDPGGVGAGLPVRGSLDQDFGDDGRADRFLVVGVRLLSRDDAFVTRHPSHP